MQWRFALKYLTSRKSHSVINVIATVSLLAVVVPVAAMVILLSVFNGFESLVRDLYKVVDADIEVVACRGVGGVDEIDRQKIVSVEGVEAASMVVERQVLLSHNGNRATARLRCVDDEYRRVVPIEAFTSSGSAVLRYDDVDCLMLGEELVYELGIYTISASEIEVHSLG